MKPINSLITLTHIASSIGPIYSKVTPDIATRNPDRNPTKRVFIDLSEGRTKVFFIEDSLLHIPIKEFLTLYTLSLLDIQPTSHVQAITTELIEYLNENY